MPNYSKTLWGVTILELLFFGVSEAPAMLYAGPPVSKPITAANKNEKKMLSLLEDLSI